MLRIILAALACISLSTAVVGQETTKKIQPKIIKKKTPDAKAAPAKAEAKPAASSSAAMTDMMVCKQGGQERQVELKYDSPDNKAPCSVHYRKVTEDPNHNQVLWTAQNDESYCESKMKEFISKLEGWGWSCGSN